MYAATANAALIRPFAILAAAGFVTGFAGYLALARPDAAVAEPHAPPAVAGALTSGAASDDWNLPKRI